MDNRTTISLKKVCVMMTTLLQLSHQIYYTAAYHYNPISHTLYYKQPQVDPIVKPSTPLEKHDNDEDIFLEEINNYINDKATSKPAKQNIQNQKNNIQSNNQKNENIVAPLPTKQKSPIEKISDSSDKQKSIQPINTKPVGAQPIKPQYSLPVSSATNPSIVSISNSPPASSLLPPSSISNSFKSSSVKNNEENNIKGQNNEVLGKKNDIVGVKNQVYGNENEIKGSSNFVKGDINYLNGNQNIVNGKGNLINGHQNIIINENDAKAIQQFNNKLQQRLSAIKK